MLRDGHVDRVIRSARRVYAQRSALVQARLGGFGTVEGRPAGMYADPPAVPGPVASGGGSGAGRGVRRTPAGGVHPQLGPARSGPGLRGLHRRPARHGAGRALPGARPGGCRAEAARWVPGCDGEPVGASVVGEATDDRSAPTAQEFDMTDTKAPVEIDADKLMSFVFRAVDEVGATLNTALVVMGDQLGYYRAMADARPAHPGGARRADRRPASPTHASGSTPRPPAAYVDYDPETKTYSLPPEHAIALTDETSPAFLPGFFQIAHGTVRDAPAILEAARNGRRPRLAPAQHRRPRRLRAVLPPGLPRQPRRRVAARARRRGAPSCEAGRQGRRHRLRPRRVDDPDGAGVPELDVRRLRLPRRVDRRSPASGRRRPASADRVTFEVAPSTGVLRRRATTWSRCSTACTTWATRSAPPGTCARRSPTTAPG